MAPSEYHTLDSLRLNSNPGSWWIDIDVSQSPLWGQRETRGAPSIVVPSAPGRLDSNIVIDACDVSFLGFVYGDFDQAGAQVVGYEECRLQMVDNIGVLQSLVGSTVDYGYVLFDRTYASSVKVTRLRQSAATGGTDGASVIFMPVALDVHFFDGVLTETGS